ncbi:MAG: hypothetical protein E7253_04790 [Lachnospiraceae bacterium]|nr:hypothetical protein [Lachnospiraceae bacterium]
MIILDKNNIISYLKERMPDIDFSGETSITAIGDGSQTAEEAGDGYVNFIFIVRTKDHSFVVKQSREAARMSGGQMPLTRNHLEFDAMKVFNAIAPNYVPKVYFIDDVNRVFVMEDASTEGRMIARFQFNQNRTFPGFARHCGRYMADTDFYTSELYLDTPDFRALTCRFMNADMRPIMEDGLFINMFGTPYDSTLGEEFQAFAKSITEDPAYLTERHKMRHIYMTKAECLIHADLHTSNLFAGLDSLKVIDMEFTFCGPFSYDLGYLIGNLVSQYASACYRDFPSEQERLEFKAYLLATMVELYETYVDRFTDNWVKYGKSIYQDVPGLMDAFRQNILLEMPGFASIVNWFRIAGEIPYPDFDMITDLDKKRDAMAMSLMMDWQIMFNRYNYKNINDFIDDLLYIEKNYSSKKWTKKASPIKKPE